MAEPAPLHKAEPTKHVPTVLVIEDEFMLRVLLSDYLQECGFKVVAVNDATEAISIIENSGVKIDLVFSNVVMPGPMDGFGLKRWLRTNRPNLPIILVSGDAKKTNAAEELCESGPLMAKPYDLETVVIRVRAILAELKL
ncbi:MAG: response regulator [Methylovirgula sp.]